MRKHILIIIIGICIGVIGVLFYEIFGKPALPKVSKCKLDFLYGMPDEDLFDVIDGIREQMDER